MEDRYPKWLPNVSLLPLVQTSMEDRGAQRGVEVQAPCDRPPIRLLRPVVVAQGAGTGPRAVTRKRCARID